MHGYKHSIDEFATALGGIVTSSGNGVKVPHPFSDTCCVLVYPNRDITSKTAFFVQLDDGECGDLKHHFGEVLHAAGIDARDTGLNVPIPEPQLNRCSTPKPNRCSTSKPNRSPSTNFKPP
jgi:hypothetical protein